MKRIFILSSLAIIILLSMTDLSASRKRKILGVIKYKSNLTGKLKELLQNYYGMNQVAIDKMEELIKVGANPNIRRHNAVPLLSCICSAEPTFNIISMIKTCLKHGADVHAVNSHSGTTDLFSARSPEVAQLLLDAHADINFKLRSGTLAEFNCYRGATALHFAVKSNIHSPEAVELLCTVTPFEPIPVDECRETPLHYAAVRLCKEDVQEKPNLLLAALQKTAMVTWWALEQIGMEGLGYETPRETIEVEARHLLNNFDAICTEVVGARKECDRPYKEERDSMVGAYLPVYDVVTVVNDYLGPIEASMPLRAFMKIGDNCIKYPVLAELFK